MMYLPLWPQCNLWPQMPYPLMVEQYTELQLLQVQINTNNNIYFQHMIIYHYHFQNSVIPSSDWCTLNSCSFSSSATSLNSMGKFILHAQLTSLVAALNSFTHSTRGQILGFWFTCGVEMMSLRHGWGWQPPQTASCIHIIYKKNVWQAHCYAVHRHTVAALHSYTDTSWLRFGGSGSLLESKWCQYVTMDGWGSDSHLKLLLASILDIYKVFECIDMLCCPSDTVVHLHSYTHSTTLKCWGSGSPCRVKMMSLRHGWVWQPPQTTASRIHIRHV